MIQTTLRLQDRYYYLFRDLKNSYEDLRRHGKYLPSEKKTEYQKAFEERNGFLPKSYETFFQTGLMVCMDYGQIIGDLKLEGGRLAIDKENLFKRKFNKEFITLPRKFSKLPLE